MYSVAAPSRCTPRVSLNWQALGRPRRQEAHFPQLVYGDSVTSTPAANAGFILLPSTMVAETSCPGTRAKDPSGFFPRKRAKPAKIEGFYRFSLRYFATPALANTI